MDNYRRQIFKGLMGAGFVGSIPLVAHGQETPAGVSGVASPSTPTGMIALWPGTPGAPGLAPGLLAENLKETIATGGKDSSSLNRKLRGISHPRLAFFPAPQPNGAAMIVAPGGGYGYVGMDGEGYDIAAWLNANGITAFVLFYRLPAEGWQNAADVPLADAQRAVRLVRARAAQYQVDPARIGMMGFSAGGHVAASLGTRYDSRVYSPVDTIDNLSARPALVAPIYPVISMVPPIAHMRSRTALLGEHPTSEQLATYSPEQMVSRDTPPFFLAHAENDSNVVVDNTLVLRAALKKAGVTVETHLFPEGGHGFAQNTKHPCHAWKDLFLAFARARHLYT